MCEFQKVVYQLFCPFVLSSHTASLWVLSFGVETDKHFTTEKWVLYSFALILVGVGVLLLVRKRAAALGISTTSLFPVPVEDVKAMMTEALLPDKGKGSA